MAVGTRHMTADQLLGDLPDGRCELIDGKLVMMPYHGYGHGLVAGCVSALLQTYVDQELLGVVCALGTGFIIGRNPDTVRAPDAAFVSTARNQPDEAGFFPGPPDLAVEVDSPDDKVHEVEAKAKQWLDAGALAVWVLWPQTRSVTVHQPDQPVRIPHDGDTLDGGDVVPGFGCRVLELFP